MIGCAPPSTRRAVRSVSASVVTASRISSSVAPSSLYDGRLITDEPLRWLILANCVAQSIDAGIFIQSALYEQSMERKTKWSIPFVLLFIALAINVGKSANGLAIFLTLPGAFLIVLGQKTVFGDRKRGDYWMQTGKVNPDPIVYSYGELFFMTGWILFSLAMSIAV